MDNANFTTSINVSQSPAEVFKAINNVRGWWSEEINGNTEALNAIFDYHYQDVHICKMQIIESRPYERIVWSVLENFFKFTTDKTEWIGNKIIFDITRVGDQTQLVFTQVGLVPAYECYDICNNAWTQYIQHSLHALITTGIGMPNGKDKPQTDDEKNLSENN